MPFEKELIENERKLVTYRATLPFAELLSIEVDGELIIADENYCVAPGCKCNEVHFCYFYNNEDYSSKNEIHVDDEDVVYIQYDYKKRKWGDPDIGRNLKDVTNKHVEQFKTEFSAKYQNFGARAKKHHYDLRSLYKNHRKTLMDIPSAPPTKKVGRNESCPCSSGKKYKKCCALKG